MTHTASQTPCGDGQASTTSGDTQTAEEKKVVVEYENDDKEIYFLWDTCISFSV